MQRLLERFGTALCGLCTSVLVAIINVAIARMTGTRLHICHLSSARSVELVRRAKAEGIRVTAEVTPHHLVFTDDDLVTYDTDLKVNPPLRSLEDRDRLAASCLDFAARLAARTEASGVT